MYSKKTEGDAQKTPIVRLTNRDIKIAQSVAANSYLTTEQLYILHFPSIHRTRKRLSLLYRAGMLDRIKLPLGLENLTSQAVYAISKHGLHILQSKGLCYDIRVPKKMHSRPGSLLFLSHTLSRNSFRIALTRSTAPESGMTVDGWKHDNAITKYVQMPGMIGGNQLTKFPLRADAEFQLKYNDNSIYCFLEIDNGTTDLGRLVTKMIGYTKLRLSHDQISQRKLQDMRVLVLTFSKTRKDNIVRKLTTVAREHMVRPLWLIASVEQEKLIITNIQQELYWTVPSVNGSRHVILAAHTVNNSLDNVSPCAYL